MKNIRQQLENHFSNLGHWAFRNRIKALLLMLLLTCALAAQLPKLVVDTRNEAFFLKDDDALVKYDEFREQFGKDESFVLAVNPPQVFSEPFLQKLKRFHEELEASVPYLDEITSLINARNTRGEEDELIVEELFENWPRDADELAGIKQRVLENPLYLNQLISPDAGFTTLLLKPQVYLTTGDSDVLAEFDATAQPSISAEQEYLSNDQYLEMADAIRAVMVKYQADDFPIFMAGLPAVTADLDRAIRETMATLVPLSYLLTIVFLLLMFRRLSGVLYPLLIVALGTLATLGSMPLLGATLNNLSTIIPTFITVVGIADSVHILAVFYRRYNETGDKEEAIAYALGHSGLAILMTSATTAGGLLSFLAADVGPVAEFGLVTPVGIMLLFIYTVILLPALISLFPMARPNAKTERRGTAMDRMLETIAVFSCRNSSRILLVSTLLVVCAAIGMSQLYFSHNGLKWFPETHPIRVATAIIDEKLAGSMGLEVVVDTGRSNGLYDPALLKQLSASVDYCESLRDGDTVLVGKAWSLDSIVKEINRALNENRPEYYSIPQDRNLVAQELFLFEGTGNDDLEKVIDADFSKVRFTLKAPFRDAFEYQPMVEQVRQHFLQNYPQADITVTGEMALIIKMLVNVIKTMATSYGISLVVITLLMMLLIGRVRIGMLSMIPNLVPLFLVAGMMGLFSVPLDFSSMLTGSIAIGLVVDDTIHFMHNFRRYFEQSNDVELAVRQTLLTAGRAILVTSVVLSVGFFSYMSVEMKNTIYFGAITGSAVVLALFADFFLTPALMTLAHRQPAADLSTTLSPGESK